MFDALRNCDLCDVRRRAPAFVRVAVTVAVTYAYTCQCIDVTSTKRHPRTGMLSINVGAVGRLRALGLVARWRAA